jgi:GMP synthase-like glutamine amidotransferase
MVDETTGGCPIHKIFPFVRASDPSRRGSFNNHLIIMGGPMSVNDEWQYPWIGREKEFVGKVIQRGLPVIGVCLGARMIASALGARVFALKQKEIGWFPIETVNAS